MSIASTAKCVQGLVRHQHQHAAFSACGSPATKKLLLSSYAVFCLASKGLVFEDSRRGANTRSGANTHSNSARARSSDEAKRQGLEPGRGKDLKLPALLYDLLDARKAVAFPSPSNEPLHLDNKTLDRLVRDIAAQPSIWKRSLQLFHWLRVSGHGMDGRLVTTFMRVCSSHAQPLEALQIYQWVLRHRRQLVMQGGTYQLLPHTYTEAMRAALDAGMLTVAMSIWKDAQQAGVPRDVLLTCTYMRVLSKGRRFSQVLQLWTGLKDKLGSGMPLQAHVLAMRAMTETGASGRALKLYSQLARTENVVLSGQVFSAAICACAANKDSVRGHTIFREMLARGVKPDVVTCGALLASYAEGGAWLCCERTLAVMPHWGVQPNAHCYAALAAAYSQAREWHRAADLLRRALEHVPGSDGPVFSPHMLTGIIHAAGEAGRVDLAEAAFAQANGSLPSLARRPEVCVGGMLGVLSGKHPESCKGAAARGVELADSPAPAPAMAPDCSTDAPSLGSVGARLLPPRGAVSVADAAGRDSGRGSGEGAATVLERSQPSGASSPSSCLQPEHGNAVLLLRLWEASGAELATEAMGNGAQAARGVAAEVHEEAALRMVHSFDAPALAIAEAREAVAAFTLPHGGGQSRAHGMTPSRMLTAPVFGALMHAYAQEARWRDATKLVGMARAAGVAPSSSMYLAGMHAAAVAGEPEVARVLLDAMPGRPTRVAWETLAFAQAYRGLAADVEATLATLQAHGHRPRDYAAVALITAYSMSGRPRLALRVAQRLQTLRVKPTVHVLNALLSTCVRHGYYDRGLQLCRSFKVQGSTVQRSPATEQLIEILCQKEVSIIGRQQAMATALSAAAAAVGGVLVRNGFF